MKIFHTSHVFTGIINQEKFLEEVSSEFINEIIKENGHAYVTYNNRLVHDPEALEIKCTVEELKILQVERKLDGK